MYSQAPRKGKVNKCCGHIAREPSVIVGPQKKGVCGKRLGPLKKQSCGVDAHFGWRGVRPWVRFELTGEPVRSPKITSAKSSTLTPKTNSQTC